MDLVSLAFQLPVCHESRENPVDALCNEAQAAVSANDGSTGLGLLAEAAPISDSINNSQASTHMHESGRTVHLLRLRGGTGSWSLTVPESKNRVHC